MVQLISTNGRKFSMAPDGYKILNKNFSLRIDVEIVVANTEELQMGNTNEDPCLLSHQYLVNDTDM